jgi:hypothetical protein
MKCATHFQQHRTYWSYCFYFPLGLEREDLKVGAPRGRCCCVRNQHAACCTFQIVRSKHARGWFSSLSLSLCESVRLQKKAVSAVLSRRREKQNGSSLFIRLRFHLAHSRSTSALRTQCVFMHKQKLLKLFRASTSKISLLITFECALRGDARPSCAFKRSCTYVSGVQKIALLFYMICEYARADLLPTACVCAVKVKMDGANFRVSFVYTSLPISATQKPL